MKERVWSTIFYSDMFDVGYEAVGELDADAEQVVDWKRPFEEGTINYYKRDRLVGILYWNINGQADTGRRLISDARRIP